MLGVRLGLLGWELGCMETLSPRALCTSAGQKEGSGGFIAYSYLYIELGKLFKPDLK